MSWIFEIVNEYLRLWMNIWDCEEFSSHWQLNIIIIKAILKLPKLCITIILAILSNHPFNAQFYNLSYNYQLAIPMLHYSQIYFLLWLLTIYNQVTVKNYLETVPWCKAAFYLSDWTVLISMWRAIRSNSYIWWNPWGRLVQWKAEQPINKCNLAYGMMH